MEIRSWANATGRSTHPISQSYTNLIRKWYKYANVHKSILGVFPFFSLSLSLSPSCVFLLSPFVSGSLLLTIKKLPICPWRRHNCHYYCCGPAHHTVYWLFRREGGGKHCLLCADATQYYHSVTTAHPHTHAQSLYLTLFSPLRLPVIFLLSTEQTWVSIGWKFIHRCLWKKKKKFNCQALGKHTLCHRQ